MFCAESLTGPVTVRLNTLSFAYGLFLLKFLWLTSDWICEVCLLDGDIFNGSDCIIFVGGAILGFCLSPDVDR